MNRDLIESYKQEICEIRRLSRSRVRLRQGGQKAARGVSKALDWAADNPYKAAAMAAGIAGAGAGGAYLYNRSGSAPDIDLGLDQNSEQQQKASRKSQTKAMQTRLKQEMANIRSAGDTDEVAIRKKAIENLGKDEDFVAQANEMGYAVGKVGGSDNAMFGYRHSTGAEAKKASDASKAQLFDAQGRAKVFERDPSTGQMVGRSPTEAEVAARKQPVAPSQTDSGESRATYYGRLAQRGVNIFKEPRSIDDQLLRQAAERDIEREGPLDRYKNRVEVMRGMEERGFEIGGGDDYALFKEKEAAKKEANKELERLTAQYGDQPIPQQEVDDIMRKRNKTVDFADQNIGRINPKTKIRR